MATKSGIRRFLVLIDKSDYKVTDKMCGYLVERPDGHNVFIHLTNEDYESLIYNLTAER